MKHLFQLSILFFICILGDFLAKLLPFTFPGTIMSMFLVLFFLLSHILKEEHISDAADFLLQNMAFLFLPAGIAIMEKYDLLKGKMIIFLFICFITTIFTFLATAYTMKLVIKLQKKEGK
ncbi:MULTISPECIES: CidA/LrgA family protein [Anaerostipes]|uniref:CidA/LrgA family protein n=1 Tax=Anaerostipes TaxID=207244 RepID=UPI00095164FA|nr:MULTISPECIES: CidA/LrgA family protein [Anaerostipes]MCI5623031.1 CidA/LrgA family protein [Anaerostipes sp.]OLR58741.1 murein hydrolase transporter LrgA [Anaerostipes sp. 494a]